MKELQEQQERETNINKQTEAKLIDFVKQVSTYLDALIGRVDAFEARQRRQDAFDREDAELETNLPPVGVTSPGDDGDLETNSPKDPEQYEEDDDENELEEPENPNLELEDLPE